jgi:acid stress-induced BolA-like protein IbaG/YrbA
VDLREKVADILRRALPADHVDLRDEGGVYGVAVSSRFEGMTPLDRQREIEKVLRDPSAKLTAAQRRRVLAIAPFTPVEFEYSFAASHMTGRAR